MNTILTNSELLNYRNDPSVSIVFYLDQREYERYYHTNESYLFKRKECMKVLHLTTEKHLVLAIKTRAEFEK
jgi:hypothetical protein